MDAAIRHRFALGLAAIAAVALFGSADGPTTRNAAIVAEARTGEAWKQRRAAFVERAKKGNADVVFAGDSLTQQWETEGKAAWDDSFSDWKPANLGIGGDRTQHLLWRLSIGQELAGLDPKVIILLIGTNNLGSNSPGEIALGIQAVVAECRKQKPKTQILLLGLLPRSGRPVSEGSEFAPAVGLNTNIAAVNKLLLKLEDETAVTFLDIGEKFLDAKGNLPANFMPDFLHLSAEGYRLWATSLRQPVQDLVSGKPSPRRAAKGAERRVDGLRGRLMMWVSGGSR